MNSNVANKAAFIRIPCRPNGNEKRDHGASCGNRTERDHAKTISQNQCFKLAP